MDTLLFSHWFLITLYIDSMLLMKKSNTKPDVLIGFKHQKKLINCLVLEVKRPTATSKYQAENDHVELLKQMKTSIDFQVKLFIKSPVSFGVLCQGSYWQERSM